MKKYNTIPTITVPASDVAIGMMKLFVTFYGETL